MAIFDGKLWKGPIGPVSFKGYRDKQGGQSKPGKGTVKQALTTKTAAATFAVSGNLVRTINEKFAPLLNNFQDGTMYNRLNSRISMIYDSARNRDTGRLEFNKHSFEILQGFEFNRESELIETFRIVPRWSYADNILRIKLRSFKIPEQLKFPKDVSYCKITFYTLLFDLINHKMVKEPEEHGLIVTRSAQVVEPHELLFNVPDGALAITGMFLEFYNERRGFQTLFINKHYYPTSICAVTLVPGTFNDKLNRVLEDIPKPMEIKKLSTLAPGTPNIE